MWFGAVAGLNRFDGKEIKSIRTATVHTLHTDPSGDVWLGTSYTGLACISTSRDMIIHYGSVRSDEKTLSGWGVRAILSDHDGTMWIGTDNGLDHLDPTTGIFTRFGHKALADSGVMAMADDGMGNLWLATRGSIVRFEKDTRRARFVCKRPNWLSAVSVAPDGSIWIAGSSNGNLCKIDPKTMRVDSIFEEGFRVPITSIAVDGSGIVYVGTSGMGLKIYDPAAKSWMTYRHRGSDPFSIADDDINTIVIDKSGNVWVGTSRGVSWAPRWRRQFSYVSIETDDKGALLPGEVRDIVEDINGNLWLATYGGGLRKWDRNRGTVTAVKTESRNIYSLGLVHHDQLWIGMREGVGLRQLNIADTTSGHTEPVLPLTKIGGVVTAILKEGDSTMWLGCTKFRLVRYDLRTSQSQTYAYETSKELNWGRLMFAGNDAPRMIYRDRKGTLWITTNAGILKFDESTRRFQKYVHNPFVHFQDNTWCVYEDSKGRFWVGNDLGLDLFDRTKGIFQHVIHEPWRLQGRTIVGILEDRTGSLWLQTDQTLLKYIHDAGEMRQYGPKDGYPITMLGTFFNWGNRARCITRTGEFVFGIRDGIVLFRPEEMHENPNKPVVAITGVELLGQPMPRGTSPIHTFTLPKQPLRLAADQNGLEFTFAALEYTAPSQNRFAVWLEPEDRSWLNIGTQHSVRFANLSPGSYRLRVKAANNDSVWSANEASYNFEILPPWWMTWWFRTLTMLIAVGVIILIMQLILRRAVAEERLRTKIARDLHDDLSATLSSITFYSEAARRSGGGQPQPYIGQISESAREAKEKISDIIWSVDPQHDDWVDFLTRCERYASDLLESKGILHELGIAKSFPSPLQQEVRQNLWLIFKEIIVNLVRHSCASRAIVSITRVKNSLVMTVSDNGKGFDPAASCGGNGLNNIRKRAKSIGASLVLDTTPGGGTRWRIELSL
ncbi:MAG: triple tyrosine motif-containing protein [Ignavibacteriales bacterium]|nr:triple tyrosine motif-containing protein [Ignavibacteriales bacterium]